MLPVQTPDTRIVSRWRTLLRETRISQLARLSIGVAALGGGATLLGSNLVLLGLIGSASWTPLAANLGLLFGGGMFLREYRRSLRQPAEQVASHSARQPRVVADGGPY